MKVNGQVDTRIHHSGLIREVIIWRNGNLRRRRNGQRPLHAWKIVNAKLWKKPPDMAEMGIQVQSTSWSKLAGTRMGTITNNQHRWGRTEKSFYRP
jgi:hypothetical protein